MKQKITFVLVMLFGLLVLVGTLGILRINALAGDAGEILKDNYISLEYVQRMQRAMENLPADAASLQEFEESLKKQQANITETGEQDATVALSRYFEAWKRQPADSTAYRAVRQNLLTIAQINLEAIARKNDHARFTAERSVALIGIIATFCMLIGFTFLLNFPGYVANPILHLTAGIREIAKGNYDQRIRLDRKDEFGELAAAFNELAAKLDAYEHSNLARLMFEKRRLETIIGAMNDPVIGLDEHQVVLFANPAAARLLNLPPEKLIGKDARDAALHNDLLRTMLKVGEDEQPREPLKIFADGKESYFQPERYYISAPATAAAAAPQPIGQVLFLKNITHFRERDLAKTNFIATISHELKTPISALKMGLSLLDDERIGSLNAEQKQLLGQIGEDANRLLSITGELLKLAQAETGNIQLNIAPVDPARLVDTACQALATQARDKHISLLVDGQLPDGAVLADADKAVWVLVNLLSNAIRHSPEGQTVELSLLAEADQMRFMVLDRGPGVPADWRDKIFERYVQAPGSTHGGTGLGLAISREFVRAMGGDIGVDSAPGKGSNFWFTLKKA
ncbi:MAG: ATP-binding protein [Saprospiraceae bacterium]